MSDGDPPIRIRIYPGAGEFSVTPAVFPSVSENGPLRPNDDSNTRQKRLRVWRLVSERGLTMVTTFHEIPMGERTLPLAARRLREKHQRRFETPCDYVLLTDFRNPATVHAFTAPYPLMDRDVVTDLFPLTGADPDVRVVPATEELRDVVSDATYVLAWRRSAWVTHVTSRTGQIEIIEATAPSLEEGLAVVREIVAPSPIHVDSIQRFGDRPRAYGRYGPTVGTERQADDDQAEFWVSPVSVG